MVKDAIGRPAGGTAGEAPGPAIDGPADPRARRRAELLDACVACIRAEGPQASMEQLAAACGVTKPILYRHFVDRTGLVAELGHRFVTQLVEELAPALASDLPPQELLRTTIDGYLGLIERDTNLYRFVSDHVGGDRRDLAARLVAQQIAQALAERLLEAGRPADHADTWAHALVGMVHFAGDWWVDTRPVPRSTFVDQLVLLAWDGLATLDPTAPDPDGGAPAP